MDYEGIPSSIRDQIEASAFRNLVKHLRDRPEVSNMALMTLSGFCRNCLGKWVTIAARDVGRFGAMDEATRAKLLKGSYEEFVGQAVYGMEYSEWKKKHHTKPSDVEMEAYNASKGLHAIHEKDKLKEVDPSEVCCVDVDACEVKVGGLASGGGGWRSVPMPTFEGTGIIKIKLFVLTCSDRAARGDYKDLSGPTVEKAIREVVEGLKGRVEVADVNRAVCEDDRNAIVGALKGWGATGFGEAEVGIIITTGGTGFSLRDVAPEATREVLIKDTSNILQHALMLCSEKQPLACLSRGICGLMHKNVLVANLPGQPDACKDVVDAVMPGILHWAKASVTSLSDV